MTVMFCDVVDSTPLAASLDPEDWREVLSAYQCVCSGSIERWGGYTARYIGDGVVAYFGYPRAHEDDAHRAVHAGLGIIAELTRLEARLAQDYGITLRVRIGLHSGMVVAGAIGVGDELARHEVVGEMPHIAARIEKLATPMSVAISDQTRVLVQGYFDTESLGSRTLKGVSRKVGVHRVLRGTGAVGRLEVTGDGPLPPLVGRGDELAALAAAWERAAAGQGQIVHLTGEAGIGKSRVVRALIDQLAPNIAAAQMWQCSAHYTSTSLHPVIRCLERLVRLDRTQPDEFQLEALRHALDGTGLQPTEALPLLSKLLAIGDLDPEAPAPAISPRDLRVATLRALESLLIANPNHHPLLLVVEDLHWADPTTEELLERIIDGLRVRSVLCILTFRPEFAAPWAGRPNVATIELGPLSGDEVREMVSTQTEAELSPAVLSAVESAAEGVPLFIEEMVKMLRLAPAEAEGDAGGGPTAVPPTLEGLLTERLDRLPDLGDVIDVASILGREFDLAVLTALEPLGAAELAPALNLLAAQGVLRPVSGSAARFEFCHTLLQEAAYERILRRRRQALHRRVAETISTRFGSLAEREPEVLAHHWSRGGEPGRAAACWHDAGTRALGHAAFVEAAEHFRRGLNALDEAGSPDAVRADFLVRRGASLQAAYGYASAGVEEAYAEAATAFRRAGDDDRLAVATRGRWMYHLLRGQYGTALELADEMLALGTRDGQTAYIAEAHLYRGLALMYRGELENARTHLIASFDSYRRPAEPDEIYNAQGDTGTGALAYNALVSWNLGLVDESTQLSDESLELADRVGGLITRAQAWGMRSILHLSRSEPAAFADWVGRSAAHSAEHDIGYWRTLSSLFAGWIRGRSGDLRGGIEQLEQSLDAYVRSGSNLSIPHFHVLLADLKLAADDPAHALDLLERGAEYIEASGERFSESDLYRFKGRALMSGPHPDPDGASDAYRRAVDVARDQRARMLELRATAALVRHERACGDPAAAEVERLLCLSEWFGARSDVPELVRAQALVGS